MSGGAALASEDEEAFPSVDVLKAWSASSAWSGFRRWLKSLFVLNP
jgi:hypothetical protein